MFDHAFVVFIDNLLKELDSQQKNLLTNPQTERVAEK